MWLDNVKELKKKTGMTAKVIAAKSNLPDKTVENILSGAVKNPRIDTIRVIVTALGGSLDEIFTESGAVIGDQKLSSLQSENAALSATIDALRAELVVAQSTITAQKAMIDLQDIKLAHKDEIIAHKDKIIALYEK